MNEIKVEFHRFDNFVFGRVVSMPEELRGVGKIISNDTYSISSANHPELYGKSLFLRGDKKDRDNFYFGCNYETLAEAQLAISNFEKLIRKWNAEHREILDDAEKEYLVAVIKPFKDRIDYIVKKRFGTDKEYLHISMTPENFYLPNFDRNQMYKGMTAGNEYTLKELKLEVEK